ncbi:helix-turn-helix domain-containing protein [Catenulispora yoronensis]|uniref:Helix-turn-helix domain-containing protein n=1 Tax=Catenulispora yoronensis TaxID=450799 RepID=A0ABN2V3X7_9ACTN
MSNIVEPLVGKIATRIRAERDRRGWTLVQLAEASGVSRAMISRIENGESSPTAVVLGKLSAAFQLSVSELLARAERESDQGSVTGVDTTDPADRTGPTGLTRQADLPTWRDPDTGYRRRQITGPDFPADITEVRLPAGAGVAYPAAAFAFIRQTVWVLDGRLTFHEGATVHELDAGDTLELGEPAPCTFQNSTTAECRYVVIVTRGRRQ